MGTKGKVILAFMGSLWIAMPLYILLHEGGHVLIASLCGAKIIEFNIMEGYVVAEGGVFNEISMALFYVAGMLIPVIAFTIYLILYRKEKDKDFDRIFAVICSGIILFSIGVWVVIPIGGIMGIANPNDDVVKFIEVSKINPFIVMGCASLLMGMYSWAIWKKKIFQNGYRVLKD